MRTRTRSKYGDAHSRNCKRRPGGVIACPTHTETTLTCDSCGIVAPYYVNAERRDDWAHSGAEDHCPDCTRLLLVAKDAIGSRFDVGALGEAAVKHLIAGLLHLDPSTVPATHRPNLVAALRRALATLAHAGIEDSKPPTQHEPGAP